MPEEDVVTKALSALYAVIARGDRLWDGDREKLEAAADVLQGLRKAGYR